MVTSLHWFRKGLRLHDNPALLKAIDGATKIYPVFVIDPHFANPEYVGVIRYNFLLESLRDLDENLKAKGSRLYVLKGEPKEQLQKKFKDWGVTRFTYEFDTEPYAKQRDQELTQIAEQQGLEVFVEASHTLHHPEEYLKYCKKGEVPTAYSAFRKLFAKAGPVPEPEHSPETLPSGDESDSDEYNVPTLEEMGYDAIESPQKVLFPGGESSALERLQGHLKRKSWIAKFEKPKTEPTSLEPSTTGLSPYLKFGCISSRLFWHELAKVYESQGSHSEPPVSLHGQLLFREHFHLCGYAVDNFDKMEGNSICRPIDWDTDQRLLEAWENAETGYPWIDACMTQLKTEGWIHHLARHAVACFLTRGDLYQSWEAGARVFEKHLVDADWHINNANWMWLSCSCFFYQFFRVYSPIGFGKKTDPKGDFIRKHLPQLKKFPAKYIYEPWKAPKSVQEQADCIIGKDYPKPIVDHKEVSAENKDRIKACYDAYKAGKDIPKGKRTEASSGGKPQAKSLELHLPAQSVQPTPHQTYLHGHQQQEAAIERMYSTSSTQWHLGLGNNIRPARTRQSQSITNRTSDSGQRGHNSQTASSIPVDGGATLEDYFNDLLGPPSTAAVTQPREGSASPSGRPSSVRPGTAEQTRSHSQLTSIRSRTEEILDEYVPQPVVSDKFHRRRLLNRPHRTRATPTSRATGQPSLEEVSPYQLHDEMTLKTNVKRTVLPSEQGSIYVYECVSSS